MKVTTHLLAFWSLLILSGETTNLYVAVVTYVAALVSLVFHLLSKD